MSDLLPLMREEEIQREQRSLDNRSLMDDGVIDVHPVHDPLSQNQQVRAADEAQSNIKTLQQAAYTGKGSILNDMV